MLRSPARLMRTLSGALFRDCPPGRALSWTRLRWATPLMMPASCGVQPASNNACRRLHLGSAGSCAPGVALSTASSRGVRGALGSLPSLMTRSFAASTAADTTKASTGIPGLPVVVNAREVLIGLYKRLLERSEDIPPEAEYHKYIQRNFGYRLRVCESETAVSEIEKKIDDGQAEELIYDAEQELELLEVIIADKVWEGNPEDIPLYIVAHGDLEGEDDDDDADDDAAPQKKS